MPAPSRLPPTVRSCARPGCETAPLLELLQPFDWNPHPAERRVVIPELCVAVPVRSAADPEPQPLRDARESLLDRGRMAGVPHLQRVEALLLKLAQLAFRAVVAEVRGDGDN